MRFLGTAATIAALALAASSPASAAPHECQHPVRTGVEVFHLHAITPGRACPPALALFRWESQDDHSAMLYGCRRGSVGASIPYLRMHRFQGWSLSLVGRYREFRMRRGNSWFSVGGTDFPISCF